LSRRGIECESKKKYRGLKKIEMDSTFTLDAHQLKQKSHFFVSEGFLDLFPNFFDVVDTDKEIVHVNQFKIIDETNGCYYEGDNGVPAFILIPRKRVLDNIDYMIPEENAWDDLINNLPTSKRGDSRKAICEKYIIMGAHVLRGEPGLGFTDVKSHFEAQYNKVVHVVSRAEHMSGSVLATGVFEAITTTKKVCGIPGIKKKISCDKTQKETSIWSSIAASYDYVSSAHVDDDFFYQC
jgi:hypothetical protein